MDTQLTEKMAKAKYASLKSFENNEYWMTFFTPAYQRAATLERLYKSLMNIKLPVNNEGKSIVFEWIIVNDGSTDDTDEMVRKWCEENKLPIRYYYQENQGKHVAVNFGVNNSRSEMFLTIDSDDTLLPTALEVFYFEWCKIVDKENFKGLTARCIDPDTKQVLGTDLPYSPFDATTTDARFKHRIKGEMCGFNRVDLMKKYPFPTFDKRMRFCPESIVWFEMAKKYKERFVDVPVREYYKDTGNALTGRSTNRSISNYYGWRYGVNNLLSYLFYSPKDILKNIVGMSMDGFKTEKGVAEIIGDVNSYYGKFLVLLFMPVGYILSKR